MCWTILVSKIQTKISRPPQQRKLVKVISHGSPGAAPRREQKRFLERLCASGHSRSCGALETVLPPNCATVSLFGSFRSSLQVSTHCTRLPNFGVCSFYTPAAIGRSRFDQNALPRLQTNLMLATKQGGGTTEQVVTSSGLMTQQESIRDIRRLVCPSCSGPRPDGLL